MTERIIMDVDTGHDDAVAIDMAAGSAAIKIEGIIATAGNTSLDNALANTLNLADALHIDAPVFAGSSGPLLRKQVTAGRIHGENGFSGPVFGKRNKQVQNGNFVEFIIDTVLSNPGEISFVAVGPCTDLAIALKAEPLLASKLKRIVMMGGSSGMGNVTQSAEFNIYADPEAAQIVLHCGAPIYVMGLDCTLQTILDPSIQQRMYAIGGKAIDIFRSSMDFYIRSCLEYIHDYPAMHDPCTIAYLIDPSLFEFTTQAIEVETRGELCYGRTCLMWPDPDSNVHFARKVNAEGFWNTMAQCFQNLKKKIG